MVPSERPSPWQNLDRCPKSGALGFSDRRTCRVAHSTRTEWGLFQHTEPDSSETVVADVTTGDVDLVQIDLVEVNSHAGVMIDVAVADQNISIALSEMNAVPTAPNYHSLKDRLHRLNQFDTVSFRMSAFDFYVLNRGQTLIGIDIPPHGTRTAGSAVRTDQTNRRAGSRHQNPRCPASAGDTKRPGLCQRDFTVWETR
jgi:hypothetical protein